MEMAKGLGEIFDENRHFRPVSTLDFDLLKNSWIKFSKFELFMIGKLLKYFKRVS